MLNGLCTDPVIKIEGVKNKIYFAPCYVGIKTKKSILIKNLSPLIHNCFEEGELRKITGEGRIVKGTTFGKITFIPEVYHSNDNPHDDILQYTHPKLNVKDDKEKLNIYIINTNKYKEEAEKCEKEFLSFETINKSLYLPQPFKEYIGLRTSIDRTKNICTRNW